MIISKRKIFKILINKNQFNLHYIPKLINFFLNLNILFEIYFLQFLYYHKDNIQVKIDK